MDVSPVLVVDDDAATRGLTANVLHSEGYQIATTAIVAAPLCDIWRQDAGRWARSAARQGRRS